METHRRATVPSGLSYRKVVMQAPPDEGSAAVERAPTPTKFFKRKQLFVEMDELRGKLSAYTQQEALFSCHFNFFVLPLFLGCGILKTMAANDQYEPCKLEIDACGSCLAGCSHDRAHACTQQEIRTYEENIELPPSDPPTSLINSKLKLYCLRDNRRRLFAHP